MARDTYESPLSSRYADKEMKYIFSPDMKFKTWRKLWIALAESEKELGFCIRCKSNYFLNFSNKKCILDEKSENTQSYKNKKKQKTLIEQKIEQVNIKGKKWKEEEERQKEENKKKIISFYSKFKYLCCKHKMGNLRKNHIDILVKKVKVKLI